MTHPTATITRDEMIAWLDSSKKYAYPLDDDMIKAIRDELSRTPTIPAVNQIKLSYLKGLAGRANDVPWDEGDRRMIGLLIEEIEKYQAPAVPEGYVLVPVEATKEMARAAVLQNDWTAEGFYKAMLAAAPTPPSREGGE